jgi:hypothetical protein
MGRVRTKNEPVASIFEVLTIEHRDVAALFDQIEAVVADDAGQARDLFTVLEGSLLAHTKCEAAVVYARLEDIRELEDDVREARHEHGDIEQRLAELSGVTPDAEEWLEKLLALEETVLHHVREEEEDVFPTAMDHIDAAESRRLAAAYLQRKARVTGEPELEHARMRASLQAKSKRGMIARLI